MTPTCWRRRFARILALPEIVAVLAEDDGEAVGFALVSLRPGHLVRRPGRPARGALRRTRPPLRRASARRSSPCAAGRAGPGVARDAHQRRRGRRRHPPLLRAARLRQHRGRASTTGCSATSARPAQRRRRNRILRQDAPPRRCWAVRMRLLDAAGRSDAPTRPSGGQPAKAATSSARHSASPARSATALASTLTPMQAVSPQVTRQTVSAAPGSGPRTYIPCTSAPAM